ncbi:class I SAM-dependent methyltransferase [Planktomarina sp.]|nr:class I SAM-dependent methyltransferase [Planktomarina temperata]MDC3221715.1 class I SAM-dependent methyltransferase [Planktomarina sp.]
MFLSRVLKVAKSVTRRGYVLLDRMDKVLESETDSGVHTFLVKRAAARYDMTASADEQYYAVRYGDFIAAELARLKIKGGHLVDLACGQGRLILEMHKRGICFDETTGVDFSGEVLQQCRQILDETLPDNSVVLKESDIHKYVEDMNDHSADVILVLEVLYMVFEPEKIYQQLSKKLRPGGVAFLSLRSDLFYALTLLKQGLYESTEKIVSENVGDILGSGVSLNWTNSERILREFPEKYGLEVAAITGIGSCSGILGDPQDQICRPSQLGEAAQKYLAQLELAMGKSHPNSGRYILFSVTKATANKAKG